MRLSVTVGAAWFLFSACSAAPTPQPATSSAARAHAAEPSTVTGVPTTVPAKAKAPVLVALIVDQMGSWVFEQRRAAFSPHGGFAKLMMEGTYAPELRYGHATTSTAPGHAALFTGLPPRGSGVFANERLDDVTGKPTSMFADTTSKLVVDTVLDASSSSAAAFQTETLADALRAQRPDAQIIALSLKDRGSIPGGGKKPDLALWFDAARESFVTSNAFASSLPAWMGAQNSALKQALGAGWRPLDEAWLGAHSPTGDEQAGEGDFGPAVHFPYDLKQAQNRGMAFRGYPAADRAVIELGRAALGQLPNDAEHDHPLLLMLSLSAFDYVGHVHGPDSWESWEVLRELDDALRTWFTELEQRFGDRLTILLSADHGTAPLPETHGLAAARPWCGAGPDPYERPCSAGERLYRDDLEQRLKQAAKAALGPGDWIRGVVEPFAYFTAAAQALPGARRTALERATSAALTKHPGVARVFASRTFSAPCPPSTDESLDALVCRSLPKNAGDLYIVVKPGSFFDPHLVKGHGINHGSPYLYDRSVPLLLRAPQGARAGSRISEHLRPADFTATAAAALQIRPPAGAVDGRNLLALP